MKLQIVLSFVLHYVKLIREYSGFCIIQICLFKHHSFEDGQPMAVRCKKKLLERLHIYIQSAKREKSHF